MNLVLNAKIVKKLEKDDILVYCDKNWTNISKEEFLAKLNSRIDELSKDVEELREENKELKEKVKELRGED